MTSQIIRLPEVQELVGLGRSTIYARLADPGSNFPKPIPLGGRLIGWKKESVLNWIDEQAAKAGYEVEGAQ